MRTLSVRQPWAWLIVNGHKPVENRDWETLYRGPLLIHAGKAITRKYYLQVAAWVAGAAGIELPPFEQLQLGGVVGRVELVEIAREHESVWFQGGCFGWVLANAEPLPFVACTGHLKLFDVPASKVNTTAAVMGAFA